MTAFTMKFIITLSAALTYYLTIASPILNGIQEAEDQLTMHNLNTENR
jgi:hypothetical protein